METDTQPKRKTYKSGEIPEGVLFLTAGITVEIGSKTDKNNPSRLEIEVLGIGEKYRTWSIEYKRFEGEIENPDAGAWQKLEDWILTNNLQIDIKLIFIDSADERMTDIVYIFCQNWNNTYPVKGIDRLIATQTDILDIENFNTYKLLKFDDLDIYQIVTRYYKIQLYNNLRIISKSTDPQSPGFCHFPIDYEKEYFERLYMILKHDSASSVGFKEQALYCRVYALCAADVYLDNELNALKAGMKSKGATPQEIQAINRKHVIDIMKLVH